MCKVRFVPAGSYEQSLTFGTSYKMDHKKLHKYNKAFYERIDAEITIIIASLEKAMLPK